MKLLVLLLPASLSFGGCNGAATASQPVAFGNVQRGARLIAQAGCGTCHEIPGISGANGHVGPPLDDFAERTIIAGYLPNTPDNLRRWLENPQAIVPGNAMPNMELSSHDAQDIAAYLYTLR